MDSTKVQDTSTVPSNFSYSNTVSIFSFVLLCAIYYHISVYSYWKKRNISGPRPWPIVGNSVDFLLHDRRALEKKWHEKYGKIYGIYIGQKPHLVISEAKMIQQISIKDFEAFQNHKSKEFINKQQNAFIFNQRDAHWKKVRGIMSPTFTSGKIKRMFKFLDICADDLINCFKEQMPQVSDGKERSAVLNVRDTYNLYTMDSITSCCYGLKLERAGSTNLKAAATTNDFIRMCVDLFTVGPARLLASLSVPKPILRLIGFELLPWKRMIPIERTVTRMIDIRRKSPKKFDDYLQLLIDAKLEDKMELGEMDLEENHHAGLTKDSLLADQDKIVSDVKSYGSTKNVLENYEIIANAFVLLAVGMETTSILLSNVSYALAFHPQVQQKLYDEIYKLVEYNEDKSRLSFDYESVTSCKYLDAVLSECLRLMTPVFGVDRQANRDYLLEKLDLKIPKGSVLNLNLFAPAHDPDYWSEPEKFDPERFMPGNKEKIVPGSYCPFGQGPRHCIGMRFSLTEAKLALAKMITNFRFEPAPDAIFPPPLKKFATTYRMQNPEVKVVLRERS